MEIKNYLKHSWCHPSLVVNKSTIHAKGVFSTSIIKKGEKVFVFGGDLISRKQTGDPKYREMSIFPVDENLYLGSTVEEKDEYLNHSCDANTWLINEVTVVARRDIERGEEITLDCATWDSDSEWRYSDDGACRCGSKVCRKILSPDDWKKTEIQDMYRNHFAPYIQKKIDKLK